MSFLTTTNVLLSMSSPTYEAKAENPTFANDTVSAVIPCYNGEQFLKNAIDSVLAQTRSVCEIIVVDDGSTDGSVAVARSYGASVTLIAQPNAGTSAARNRAIGAASGQWLAFLDQDDRWHPRKLERQFQVVTSDVVAVHSNVFAFGSRNGQSYSSIHDYSLTADEKRYRIGHIASHGGTMYISSLLVRKNVSPEFREYAQYCEDMIYGLDLLGRGKIRLVPEPLCECRWHDNSATMSNALVVLRRYEALQRWLRENADRCEPADLEQIQKTWLDRIRRVGRQAKSRNDSQTYRAIKGWLTTNDSTSNLDTCGVRARCWKWVHRIRSRLIRGRHGRS